MPKWQREFYKAIDKFFVCFFPPSKMLHDFFPKKNFFFFFFCYYNFSKKRLQIRSLKMVSVRRFHWGPRVNIFQGSLWTCRTDQNSLTFPWRKFKFPWQYWSRKFYEFCKKDTSGPNIPASSGWNVKFPDISLKFLQNIIFPWHTTEFPDNSLTFKKFKFPWHVWTLYFIATYFKLASGTFFSTKIYQYLTLFLHKNMWVLIRRFSLMYF